MKKGLLVIGLVAAMSFFAGYLPFLGAIELAKQSRIQSAMTTVRRYLGQMTQTLKQVLGLNSSAEQVHGRTAAHKVVEKYLVEKLEVISEDFDLEQLPTESLERLADSAESFYQNVYSKWKTTEKTRAINEEYYEKRAEFAQDLVRFMREFSGSGDSVIEEDWREYAGIPDKQEAVCIENNDDDEDEV